MTSKSKFDIERLEELRAKAEHDELTDEELAEVSAMFGEFRGAMEPAIESMGEVMNEAAQSFAEGLQPIAEGLDDDE